MGNVLAKTLPDWINPTNKGDAWKMAEMLASSSLVPSHFRKKPIDILLTMMHGATVGIAPIQAIQEIYVVDGKPTSSSKLMHALVVASGEAEYFSVVESTNERATIETKRKGDPSPLRITFTIDDAKRAGLLNKDNWKKHPSSMLVARARARAARAGYPDVVMGLYTRDELNVTIGADEDEVPVVVETPEVVVEVDVQEEVFDESPELQEALESSANALAEHFGSKGEATDHIIREYKAIIGSNGLRGKEALMKASANIANRLSPENEPGEEE